jgi:uncharacterized protein
MEPIQGGNLSINPPKEIQALWDKAKIKRSPAEWALQWVWNQPEVSLALSGMTTMDHVVENLKSASRSGPGTLTEDDLKIISKVREKYLNTGFIGCTGCRYCSPCPNGVAIPEIMALYNQHYTKRDDPAAQKAVVSKYMEMPAGNRAEACVKCGECEGKCPQQLPIRTLIARADRAFKGGPPM